MKRFSAVLAGLLVATTPGLLSGYPIWGSEDTGIRRLAYERLVQSGELDGRQRSGGELLTTEQVQLRLLGADMRELPPSDEVLANQLRTLLPDSEDRYSLAVLDLSDPSARRYAEINGRERRNPGSVGKIVVGAAIFQALADAWPDDLEQRRRILRETEVVADDFIISDGHTVRLFDPATRALQRRPLALGDTGSLYDWLDWMMSASSNAAAAVMMREAMLMRHFGRDYPVPRERAVRFFEETPRTELADLLRRTMDDPLTRAGLDVDQLRQGSLFTRTGKKHVPGTSSYATARELTRFMLWLESGRIVDAFSSLELKRLLYITERRIRYASSPALREDAVYFKSGSLYRCEPEEGFTCKKYHGNKLNLMNSVAIVESNSEGRRLHYLVALTSNVLRRNSAVDHQTLATRIHRLLESMHGVGD